MRKKLATIGNSLGFVIDKPILELLKIDRDTEFEVTTDGRRLVFEPISPEKRRKRIRDVGRRVAAEHSETLKKLAE
jgi:antitoxin MazE